MIFGNPIVSEFGLEEADDRSIWDFAVKNNFTAILTKDQDFHNLLSTLGFPPKVIQINLRNVSTNIIAIKIKHNLSEILERLKDERIEIIRIGL